VIETEFKPVNSPARSSRFRGALLLAAIAIIVAAVLVVAGIRSRMASASAVEEKTLEAAIPATFSRLSTHPFMLVPPAMSSAGPPISAPG
jgi:hypothetical protein